MIFNSLQHFLISLKNVLNSRRFDICHYKISPISPLLIAQILSLEQPYSFILNP
jgi:hypothetical protein